MAELAGPQRIPRARFGWLEQESERWLAAGVLDEGARGRILAGYDAESPHGRGMAALLVLAALMVGIGVLLLIGYNWARLGPYTKVAITMSVVALLFAASAFALARRRPLAAETLALIGTFAFANSIWLIAQVLHIQGHFPDAFMWSAAGALAAALVLRSHWVGVEAGLFVVAWVAAAGIAPPHAAPLPFLVFGPLAIAVAYQLRSPVMLRALLVAIALWLLFTNSDRIEEVVFLGALALTGCAFYAIGAWHRAGGSMGRAWQSIGLLVLLCAFLLLLIADVHKFVRGGDWHTPLAAVASLAALVTATLVWKRARDADGVAVAVVAAFVVAWTALRHAGVGQPQHLWVTVFSALALLLSVSLIRRALRTDDVQALAFGAGFALAFLVVRWTSVVENMLWSGLMLLAAGGGLFLVARLWRDRDRQMAIAGRAS